MAEHLAPMPLPNWLNCHFLEKQLQNYHSDVSVKLVSFDVKPAMAKGDGYCSSMFRVTVYYTDAQLPIDNVCHRKKSVVFSSRKLCGFCWLAQLLCEKQNSYQRM